MTEGEDLSRYRSVDLTLANGDVKRTSMSPGFVMVSEQKDIEPIVPIGPFGRSAGMQGRVEDRGFGGNSPTARSISSSSN